MVANLKVQCKENRNFKMLVVDLCYTLVYMRKLQTTTYQFPVIIEKDEDGFFVADCPDLVGCHAQGDTLEEAITNIRDVIKLHLTILKEDKQEIPTMQTVSLTSLEVSL